MFIFNENKFLIVFGLILSCFVGQLQAEEFRYRYVNLTDKVPPPPNNVLFSVFDAKSINDRGQVSGDISNCYEIDEITIKCEISVGIYQNGQTQALKPGTTFPLGPINQRGNVGGGVIIDPVNGFTQAAIFSKKGTELIPPLLGEISSFVTALNDNNTALVSSTDASGKVNRVLYAKGKSSLIDFGQGITTPSSLRMNNKGIISGTNDRSSDNAKAFRFNPKTNFLEVFDPLPGDDLAWGLGINAKGNVLGYSFVNAKREQIGFWDRSGKFHTYFVEGTPEFPTVSTQLFFNDKNQIVISEISSPANEIGNSYLAPKPGVRLNIADLVVNKNDMPPDAKFNRIFGINNHGDMVGLDFFNGSFLLQRLDDDEIDTLANAAANPTARLLSTELSTEHNARIREFYSKKLVEKYRKDSLR